MDLLKEIKSSLEKQSRKQGKTLCPSSDREYITYSLSWRRTIEGHLFWGILHYSYRAHGIYDYVTLVKLYHIFGRDVFNSVFYVHSYYTDYFDSDRNCLTDEGFNILCDNLDNI